ncbi:MAG: hypothetical protein WD602_01040 [Actinomycetota bacterium]
MSVDGRSRSDAPSGAVFWILFALGWSIVLYGLYGTFDQAARTRPHSFGPWFIGSALVHDMLVAPAAIAVGVAVVKAVPVRIRRYVQAGLIISAGVIAVAFPLLLGLGGPAGNPSALPHNYLINTAVVLGVVWSGVAVAVVLRRIRTN